MIITLGTGVGGGVVLGGKLLTGYTGAGDAFFAGTVIGRAYGKTMAEALSLIHI